MAKLRQLLIAATVIAVLAGCGPNGTETPAPAGSTPPAPAVPPMAPIAPIGSPAPEVGETRTPGETRPSPEPDPAQCGADKLGDYINVLPTEDMLDKIGQRIGDKTIRVVGPDDIITMDFRPDRLNIETGGDGRIKQFRCY